MSDALILLHSKWLKCHRVLAVLIAVGLNTVHPPVFNPIALRMAKTPLSFGHSECNRVKYSQLLISNTDISKKSLKSKNIVSTYFLFYSNFNFFVLKLLMSQRKFSGTRKFTLRYQYQ